MKPKEQKQAEAQERQAAHDALTLEEKLERAYERGTYNSRESSRLRAEIRER